MQRMLIFVYYMTRDRATAAEERRRRRSKVSKQFLAMNGVVEEGKTFPSDR